MILADEMGLGKTLQVIAFLAWLQKYFSTMQPFVLIICPLTALGNWDNEIKRFTPSLNVVRYHGSAEEREELREKYIYPLQHNNTSSSTTARATRSSEPSSFPLIIVTSYQIAVQDYQQLKLISFQILVFDEGQFVKNDEGKYRYVLQKYTKPTKSTKSTKSKPQIRLVLTGTPIQNDPIEIWSLLNLIQPDIFIKKEQFQLLYSCIRPDTSAGQIYLHNEEVKHNILSQLQQVLSIYLLRRTKREVQLDLPPKVEVLVYTSLADMQIRLLRALRDGTIEHELKQMGWSIRNNENNIAHISNVHPSMNFRKMCDHPYFFGEPPPIGKSESFTDNRIITYCGKMIILDKMLRKLRADGHKVLIFSQFKTIINILVDYFDFVGAKVLGDYRIITGDVGGLQRDKAIHEFNHDPENKIFAFLLSTKAGGLGINLTAADTVIFYDSDWNPKVDEQAQDRVHRIGQIRPVAIYRLISAGTAIERRMHRIAAGKDALSRVILQDGKYLLDGKKELSFDSNQENKEKDTSIIKPNTGLSEHGNCNDQLLDFWFHNELDKNTAMMQGIPDEELNMILNRDRAVQAGQSVADNAEAELLDMSSTTTTTAPTNTIPNNSGKRTRISNTTTITTRSKSTSLSNIANITPSKGVGYEFVYNQASTGLLPYTGTMMNVDNMKNNNSSSNNTSMSGNTEELLETPLTAQEKSSPPTSKKLKTKK